MEQTIGANVEERAQQLTSLFLCLTKFDMEFEEKAGGDKDDKGTRWSNIIQASFLNFLGKSNEWPHDWDGKEKPFRNLFWIRNPNVKAKSIIDYKGEKEVKIRDPKLISDLLKSFINNDLVRTYFEEPELKWDAGLSLNDGGIGLLAERLSPVCNPELRQIQIEGQLRQLHQRMGETLRPYFVGGDIEAEISKKRKEIKGLIREDLSNSYKTKRFGALIRSMYANYEELNELFLQSYLMSGEERENESPSKVMSDAISEDQFAGMDGIFEEGGQEKEDEDTSQNIEYNDKASILSAVAFNEWSEDLNALISNPMAANYYGLSQHAFGVLVSELLAGARRLKLRSKLATQIRAAMSYG